MQKNAIYAHTEHGRSLGSFFALVFSVGMTVFCFVRDAPWWMYPPVLIAMLGMGWMVIANPKSGCDLDDEQLNVYSGRWSETLQLSDIDCVRIINWSDGRPSASIEKTDGSKVFVHSTCLSSGLAFTEALQKAGVTVTQD